jgi:hypothetical protein
MARVALGPELKAAITKLAPKEKDKLLFRLIALKPELASQLEYLLLEGGETQDERRNDIERVIERTLSMQTFEKPIHLYYTLRELSAEITKHVKTTKDKYGDVWLNFIMLDRAIGQFGAQFATAKPKDQDTYTDYLVQRLKRTLKQMVALDPDFHLDFKRMRNQMGEKLAENPFFMQQAGLKELNIDWLTTTDATPDLTILPERPEIVIQVKKKARGWSRW